MHFTPQFLEGSHFTSLGLGALTCNRSLIHQSTGLVGCAWADALERLKPRPGGEHMLGDSPRFLQKNLLMSLNHRESSNLLGMAVELHVGFLCLAVID